jgi:hypothetical protein
MRAVAAAGVLLLGSAAQAAAQRVAFDRPAYRLHSIGQRLATTVHVTDASGRRVGNVQTVFRVADPSIATVSARGEVTSLKTGLTRLWAIAGDDSASAFVMVEQRAARFAFSPASPRIDALKAKVPLKVQISDSAGVPIAGAASTTANCRSLNEQIVRLNGAGELIPSSNGATYVRCTDRGFADSVRVEVRQRPTRALVGAKSISKAVGDTFSVKLRAYDRLGDTVTGTRPTWVSMDPKTVTIDPMSGRALAKAEGTTGLIAQLGDVSDTATVSVTAPRGGGLLQAPIAVPDSVSPTSSAKQASVSVTPFTMYEGETRPLAYAVKDSLQLTIQDAPVTIRSTDTLTVAPTDSGLKGLKVGQVWIVVKYQNLLDSAVVTVRDSTARATDSLRFDADVNAPIVEPTYAPGLARKYQGERDSVMNAIRTSGAFSPPSGKIWTAAIYAGLAAHSSNQSNSTTSELIEDRSGVVYGGRTTVKPFGWMALSGDLRLGTLNSPGTIGESLHITEAVGDVSFYIMPWLGLGAGYAIKSEKTQIATQRWNIPHASITARTSFVGDFISTTTSFFVLPGATFTGMPDDQQPDIGLAGEAGLELRRGRLDAGLMYYVERLPFPELLGRSRVDQFSSLRLRVGFKVGR